MESRRNNSYALGWVVRTSGGISARTVLNVFKSPTLRCVWNMTVIRLNFGFCTTKRVGSSDRGFIMSSECPHKGSSGMLTTLRLFMVLLSHRHKNTGTVRRTVPRPFPSTSVPALHSVIILLLDSVFWVVDSIVKYTTKKYIPSPTKIRAVRTIIICIYAHRTAAGIA